VTSYYLLDSEWVLLASGSMGFCMGAAKKRIDKESSSVLMILRVRAGEREARILGVCTQHGFIPSRHATGCGRAFQKLRGAICGKES